eukprot:CAMPEP_0198201410 /NCGR_PEP_ID=MMETSP1445-20131203/4250_1 /TAXON_ID=36898 /ORGANISM="Pyramimonas sp., Strain CCMP2087" /LENGTH=78 /DNA_ID=CAMNT_0043871751 /DNA_START=226 /DNA_END=463 /DNA_ORIENTATION=+
MGLTGTAEVNQGAEAEAMTAEEKAVAPTGANASTKRARDPVAPTGAKSAEAAAPSGANASTKLVRDPVAPTGGGCDPQ